MRKKTIAALIVFSLLLVLRGKSQEGILISIERMWKRWCQYPTETWTRLHQPGFEPLKGEPFDIIYPTARELLEEMDRQGWSDFHFSEGVAGMSGNVLLQRVTEGGWPRKPDVNSVRGLVLVTELGSTRYVSCKRVVVRKDFALVDCSST